jgi:hypothetical protein
MVGRTLSAPADLVDPARCPKNQGNEITVNGFWIFRVMASEQTKQNGLRSSFILHCGLGRKKGEAMAL